MGGAVGAVVAVHRVPGVAVVGVGLQLALVEAEVLTGDDLVERVVGAGEVFAGAAVAGVNQSVGRYLWMEVCRSREERSPQHMALIFQSDGPFGLFAVAAAFDEGHFV